MRESSARPRARQRANAAVRKVDKCTLLLDTDTSLKLTVAAHLRGLDRSELVNRLLTDSLRHVVISVRGQREVSASPDGGGEAGATEAA